MFTKDVYLLKHYLETNEKGKTGHFAQKIKSGVKNYKISKRKREKGYNTVAKRRPNCKVRQGFLAVVGSLCVKIRELNTEGNASISEFHLRIRDSSLI